MIPKRIRCSSELKMNFTVKIVKKEFIKICLSDFELNDGLKKPDLSELVEMTKNYVSSLWPRDEKSKRLSKMDAFGVKKLRKI